MKHDMTNFKASIYLQDAANSLRSAHDLGYYGHEVATFHNVRDGIENVRRAAELLGFQLIGKETPATESPQDATINAGAVSLPHAPATMDQSK